MTETDAQPDQHEEARRAAVQAAILQWFDCNVRDLPWRRTRDPYHILLSEVMLQQTQVDRVIPYYERFLTRFPTVFDLAAAPTAEVIRLWAGLGYNRRAVNLQRAARAVVEEHDGQFPRDIEQLKALPGIGDYTAGAIACFAYEQDVAFVDTNMRRVVERVFFGADREPSISRHRDVLATAAKLVARGQGWRWNQALIEFGALQCTSRKPLCVICPLQAHCRAFPDVQTLVKTSPKSRNRHTPEAPFAGSNRFYRGRVIDALRSHHNDPAGLPLAELGSVVREDFSDELLPWLDTLVRGLQRDGLAQIAEPEATYDASEPGEVRVRLP